MVNQTERFVSLLRSMEGHHFRVINTDDELFVGLLKPARKNQDASKLVFRDMTGATFTVDADDVADIMWTSEVPF